MSESATGGGKRQRLQALATNLEEGNSHQNRMWQNRLSIPIRRRPMGVQRVKEKVPCPPRLQWGGGSQQGSSQQSSSPLQPPSKKKCSFFLKENGCRLGSTCTFEHDRSQIMPQNPRCFNCGSVKHKKPDCEFPGGGKFVSKGSGETQQPSAKASGQGGQTSGNESTSSPNNPLNQPSPTPKAKAAMLKPEDILANAQAMLQGLQLSGVSGPKVAALRASSASSTDPFDEPTPHTPAVVQYGLLDGGATNPLRMGEQFELDDAQLVDVSLATGEDARLWMNRTGTLMSNVAVVPIVPMGCLANELGCTVAWEGSLCRVWHPDKGWLLEVGSSLVRKTTGCEVLILHSSVLWLRCFRLPPKRRFLRRLGLLLSRWRVMRRRGIGD